MESLGSQRVSVAAQVRGLHGDHTYSEPVEYSGIMLQPLGSDEQIQLGYPAVTERWRLFADALFPVAASNVLYHNGIRLHVEGNLQLCYDFDGCPDHVTGIVRRFEG